MGHAPVYVLADDLSGAAETAAVLMSPTRPARIVLSGPPHDAVSPSEAGPPCEVALPCDVAPPCDAVSPCDAPPPSEAGPSCDAGWSSDSEPSSYSGPSSDAGLPSDAGWSYDAGAPVLVVDLDTRHRSGAAGLVREALAWAAGRHVLVKIDSLLRGDVAATVHACLTTFAGSVPVPVVLASALPQAGRTVVNGVPLIHGIPLRETRTSDPAAGPDRARGTGPGAGGSGAGRPDTVAAALGAVPSAGIGLATVRAGPAALREALAETAAGGLVAVCDAETDADLDTIVAAALANDPATRLVGAGGLAAALGRALNSGTRAAPTSLLPPGGAHGSASWVAPGSLLASGGVLDSASWVAPDSPLAPGHARSSGTRAASPAGSPLAPGGGSSTGALLVVVGTAEPAAAEQARLLVAHDAVPVVLDAADLHAMDTSTAVGEGAAGHTGMTAGGDAAGPMGMMAGGDAAGPIGMTVGGGAAGPMDAREIASVAGRLRRALGGGAAVLTVRGAAPPELPALLGRIVREALGGMPAADLVLTGGETARRVLDALGVRELFPVGQVHHGAVHSRTPDGRSVVTRPGSFGGPDSLLRIAAHLRPRRFPRPGGATIDERPT